MSNVPKSSPSDYCRLWNSLSKEWKNILAANLELEDCFGPKDLEYLLTIEELDCYGHPISDLSPLAYMPNIRSLDISETLVKDLSPIVYLNNLKELHATFCEFDYLTTLPDTPNLEVLDVSYTYIDYPIQEKIHNLTNLRELYCNSCGLKSILGVTRMENLSIISAYFNSIPEHEWGIVKEYAPTCQILS
ncbi:MAG: hypothetical protein AAF824_16460 [Bacteroidota bacterium]